MHAADGPVQFTIHVVVRLVGHIFLENCPSPSGSSPSRNTLSRGPSPLIIPYSVSIDLYGSQNWPLPLGFFHPAGGGLSHGYSQNAPKHLVKIARVVLRISSWTEGHTQTSLSHYFATVPAGEKNKPKTKFVLIFQVNISPLSQVTYYCDHFLSKTTYVSHTNYIQTHYFTTGHICMSLNKMTMNAGTGI